MNEIDLNKLFAEVLANPDAHAEEIAAYDAETARIEARNAALAVKNGVTRGDCGKCGGTGHIEEFRHIAGGNCFACDGTGFAHNAR